MQPTIKKSDPPQKLAPLPDYLEKHRRDIQNFGLYYQKFGKYNIGGRELELQARWDNGKKKPLKEEYAWSLLQNQLDHYTTHSQAATEALNNRHQHQRTVLTGLQQLQADVLEWQVVTRTRFLTGIGEASPTEVGMVFDRNTGLPFIPASSIKGAVRMALIINYVQSTDLGEADEISETAVPGLIELFGASDADNARRGGVAFWDAFPVKPPALALDIMNPHFGPYYRGEGPPTEIDEPIPIQFLTVDTGAAFTVRGCFLTEAARAFGPQLNAAFETAFTQQGMGAKTAVGYGRFQILNASEFLAANATLPRAGAPAPDNNPARETVAAPVTPVPTAPVKETWSNVLLTFNPGNQEVNVNNEGKKAFCKGLNNVPEPIAKKLRKNKKASVSHIEVEALGNNYQIIQVNA